MLQSCGRPGPFGYQFRIPGHPEIVLGVGVGGGFVGVTHVA